MKFKDLLGEGKYLRLVRSGQWEYVERRNVTGIVAIVALTRKREIVLVEQMRPAVGARVVELPAGLAGDEGAETLESAARRELLEETGYEAGKLKEIGTFTPSAGLTSERVTFFLARGVKRTGAGGGDGSEEIESFAVALDEVPAFLKARAKGGALVDEKVFVGLWFSR